MFSFSTEALESHSTQEKIKNCKAGAAVLFEGWVRQENNSKQVTALEYQAYSSLAENEAEKIFTEAKQQFEILAVQCVHRLGKLKVGDIAISLLLTAKHRKAAYEASQFVMNEIKSRLPIWKKEYYTTGASSWIYCDCSQSIDWEENELYERQTSLPDFGLEGQKKLKNATVLVVGSGGLGCPVLTYLAGSGVGRIGICDHDNLDVTNLHRQTLFSYMDLGENKAVLAKKKLQQLNPFVKYEAYTEKIDENNVEEILSAYRLVVDCTDNFQTKFLLHDACYWMDRPLIQANIFQTEGQLVVYRKKKNCLRCLWPKVPNEKLFANCGEAGVLGAVTGILGSWQAMEAIKLLLGWEDKVERGMLFLDSLSNEVSKKMLPKNPDCPLCGKDPEIKNWKMRKEFDKEEKTDWEIDILEKGFELVDIRKSTSDQEIRLFESFPKDRKFVFACQKGKRSLQLAKKFREKGYTNFYSLKGGLEKNNPQDHLGVKYNFIQST
jgi:sulfur-carrier protein adenylyltransferase/sulfurtransferase